MFSMTKLIPYAHTSESFASRLHELLGRGREHAMLLYSDWMRNGRFDRSHAAFNNAQLLFDEFIAHISVDLPAIVEQKQEGETVKFLLRSHAGFDIESVLIPMKSGPTLCVSSQIGCRMGCAFCETGKMGLLSNLSAEEIVSQLVVARHQLNLNVRNIVFMGMGEPFDNYDEVMQAFRILTDAKGLGFGKRQITVSTSGHVDGIRRLMAESGDTPNLAVSITAADDALRRRLMPINRQWDLKALRQAMEEYIQQTGRQILVAYVLLKDTNDSLEHAEKLIDYLQGLDVKINVIPYNAQKRDIFQPSDDETIDAFVAKLRHHGYKTLLRRTKGRSIMAACGQLGNVAQRKLRII